MIDLKELKTPVRHPLRPVFQAYNLTRLASLLGTCPSHFNNVLLGHVRASSNLEIKISALADEIEQAEQAGIPSKRFNFSK